jgi:hypothetical protein
MKNLFTFMCLLGLIALIVPGLAAADSDPRESGSEDPFCQASPDQKADLDLLRSSKSSSALSLEAWQDRRKNSPDLLSDLNQKDNLLRQRLDQSGAEAASESYDDLWQSNNEFKRRLRRDNYASRTRTSREDVIYYTPSTLDVLDPHPWQDLAEQQMIDIEPSQSPEYYDNIVAPEGQPIAPQIQPFMEIEADYDQSPDNYLGEAFVD